MSDHAGLTLDERQEIDAFYELLRLGGHYELLGVERAADPDAIRHAYNARTRRFHPRAFSGQIPATYQQRLDAILAALDEAHTVLADPVRRYLYDQEIANRPPVDPAAARAAMLNKRTPVHPFANVGKRTPLPGSLTPPHSARPHVTPSAPVAPPEPDAHARGPRANPNFTDVVPSSRRTPALPYAPPQVERPITAPHPTMPMKQTGAFQSPASTVPATPSQIAQKQTGSFTAQPTPTPEARAGFRLPTPPHGSRSVATPVALTPVSLPGADARPVDQRVEQLEAQVTSLQGEVSTLLAEVERLAVSVQLSIAYALEPQGVRQEQLMTAGQALVSTRVVVATLLARREEAAGRWDAAAALWQRASKARPGEVMLLVRAADALRKAGANLDTAEALARQAIQLDPDCAEAHAALAVIETRRRNSI